MTDLNTTLTNAGITDAESARDWLTTEASEERPIPSRTLLKWISQQGRAARLANAAADTAIPDAVRAFAIAADRVTGNAQAEIDLSDPEQAAGVVALQQVGAITQAEVDELHQLAIVTAPRYELLGYDALPEDELLVIFPPPPATTPTPNGILVQVNAAVRMDSVSINAIVSQAAGFRPVSEVAIIRTSTGTVEDPKQQRFVDDLTALIRSYIAEVSNG